MTPAMGAFSSLFIAFLHHCLPAPSRATFLATATPVHVVGRAFLACSLFPAWQPQV